jgi:hypothetical protein
MHIWTLNNWDKYFDLNNKNIYGGLHLKFDKDVNIEAKRAFKEFCKWLRNEYYFPIRVIVYVKATYRIKALDGEMVCATFFEPYDFNSKSYIRIASGDYNDLLEEHGKDNALAVLLSSLAHELTHYFQWINQVKLTEIGIERQAKSYANLIVDEYANTRDHP